MRAAANRKITAVTLEELRNRYLAVRDGSNSGRKVYTSLLNRCLGDWLKKPLKSIAKGMVELRHHELTRPTKQGTDGKCQANMAMTALNTLFNFAMDEYETAGWTFSDQRRDRTFYVFDVTSVKIKRHKKVKGTASPDDPTL